MSRVTLTILKEKTFIEKIITRIKALEFSKPYRTYWLAKMRLHGSFFVQGLVGLVTLSFFQPNLTRKPSQLLALATSELNEYKQLGRVKDKEDLNTEIDEWLTKFTDRDKK